MGFIVTTRLCYVIHFIEFQTSLLLCGFILVTLLSIMSEIVSNYIRRTNTDVWWSWQSTIWEFCESNFSVCNLDFWNCKEVVCWIEKFETLNYGNIKGYCSSLTTTPDQIYRILSILWKKHLQPFKPLFNFFWNKPEITIELINLIFYNWTALKDLWLCKSKRLLGKIFLSSQLFP